MCVYVCVHVCACMYLFKDFVTEFSYLKDFSYINFKIFFEKKRILRLQYQCSFIV